MPTESSVKSASRTLDILEFVSRAGEPPTFVEMSAAMGIPKSSLFHLLNTLSRRGYLEQLAPKSGYRLGPAFKKLAKAQQRTETNAELVRPFLQAMRDRLEETFAYYELRGDEVEGICLEEGRQTLRIIVPVGRPMPLYAVASGKVLLAAMDDQAVEAYLSRTTFKPFTPATVRSAKELWREIQGIRQTGFGRAFEEYTAGAVAIATALRRGGQVVGGIACVVPRSRYDSVLDDAIAEELRNTATRFEREN